MKKRKKIKQASKIFAKILLFLAFVIIFTAIYIKNYFGDISFEQLLYTIRTAEGTSVNAIDKAVFYVLLLSIVSYIVVLQLGKTIEKLTKNSYNLTIKFRNIEKKVSIWKLSDFEKNLSSFCLFIFSLVFIGTYLGFFDYVEIQKQTSSIFEDYYVDPNEVSFTFPETKQNLIYIVVESLEMTGTLVSNGGSREESFIPNLEKIALENTNFSNNELLGGAIYNSGTAWTAASLIGQTAGIPLKVSIDGNSYLGYSSSLPGVYSIGDILKENGYRNYFMLGSDANFAGRKDYFLAHGSYEILDFYWARESKLIDDDYYVWWGYEDIKLYEFAKEKLKEISSLDGPFNFTMLTADTHFLDGYLDDTCPSGLDSHYADSYYCADIMLNEFINWIKEQDFYENTTVVIVGDHLTMQNDFYGELDDSYERVIYNAFLNSLIDSSNNKNRIFTVMDMFPTTLAALGVEIDGNRLGLGTNLYSNKQTLIEELGVDKFNLELSKKSNYYDNILLGDTYYGSSKLRGPKEKYLKIF